MTVHLMRHGEPVLTGRLLGWTDCAVTDAGMIACRDAAETLEVEAVVSSDLRRARRCAEAIATVSRRPVRIDARWRELNFGEWDGRTASAIDPHAMAAFWDDPDASPPPSGERWSTLVTRVGAALAELDRPTLVVSHAGAIRAALGAACRFSARDAWAVDCPYASVLSLRIWRGEPIAAQITGLRA